MFGWVQAFEPSASRSPARALHSTRAFTLSPLSLLHASCAVTHVTHVAACQLPTAPLPCSAPQVAGQYVGDDRELQRTLLRSMLVAGELSLAAQHQQLFGLSSEFEIHPERLAEEQERRRQQFLQLPLPTGAVRYVDCAQGLAAMRAALAALLAAPHRHGSAHSPVGACREGPPAAAAAVLGSPQAAEPAAGPAAAAGIGAHDTPPGSPTAAAASCRDAELLPVLGIDLEWQPDSENSSPPSVLQISTGAL